MSWLPPNRQSRCTVAPFHAWHGACLQILVELAELQDQEVGDGTTSVVIVAAEFLKRANDLVRSKIHPTSIIGGFRLAMREVRGLMQSCQWQNMAGALRAAGWPREVRAPH